MKDVTTGGHALLHDKPIILERMEFPAGYFGSRGARTRPDQEKMGLLWASWPRRIVIPRAYDEESGQTIISAYGELHLDILVDRDEREFRRRGQYWQAQVWLYVRLFRNKCEI